jgi:hypothetical protein
MPDYTLIELNGKTLEFSEKKISRPEHYGSKVHRSVWGYFTYTTLKQRRDIEHNKDRLIEEMISDTATQLGEMAKQLRQLKEIKEKRKANHE